MSTKDGRFEYTLKASNATELREAIALAVHKSGWAQIMARKDEKGLYAIFGGNRNADVILDGLERFAFQPQGIPMTPSGVMVSVVFNALRTPVQRQQAVAVENQRQAATAAKLSNSQLAKSKLSSEELTALENLIAKLQTE